MYIQFQMSVDARNNDRHIVSSLFMVFWCRGWITSNVSICYNQMFTLGVQSQCSPFQQTICNAVNTSKLVSDYVKSSDSRRYRAMATAMQQVNCHSHRQLGSPHEKPKKSGHQDREATPTLCENIGFCRGVARVRRGGTHNPYISKKFCIFTQCTRQNYRIE